jgi:RNA polymerase sigma factor (TIGR02999 family)
VGSEVDTILYAGNRAEGDHRSVEKDPQAGEVTQLLARVQRGEAGAVDVLLPLVYEELRRIAQRKIAREREGHTLQPTALANEALLKLLDQQAQWTSRAHFLAVAALAMRRILINHAQARLAEKRGGGQAIAELPDEGLGELARPADLVALDEALERLAAQQQRCSRVVTYKFFGGMGYEEIAEALGVSVPTVRRDWRFARAWLLRELNRDR